MEKQQETKHYHGYVPNTPLLSFIKNNPDTYSFYIWTNNSTAVIQDFLTKESMHTVFKKIVTHDVVTYVKPDADGFLYIKDPHIALAQYLFIGDNPFTDQRAAQNADIDFFSLIISPKLPFSKPELTFEVSKRSSRGQQLVL